MPDKDKEKVTPLTEVESFPSRTHKYSAKCGIELFIITNEKTGDIADISVGKAGSCKSIMWEVMAKLLNEIKPEKIVEIMSHYNCEHGGLGGQSCFDKVARLYRAQLPESKEKK